MAMAFIARALLVQAAGAALAAGGAAFYFSHPQRVVAELPPDLARLAQHVHLEARDGARLHAIWLPAQDAGSHRTILHCHGYSGSAGVLLARGSWTRAPRGAARNGNGVILDAWALVRAGMARGFNFLLVDMRAHGRSGGTWDSAGALQMADLTGWVTWLRETHVQLWVGLWAHSIGASVGLALAARPAGGGLDAMVLDSPPVTARGLYAGALGRPLYVAMLPVICGLLRDRDLIAELDGRRLQMPLLLIHGEKDRHVPVWHSRQVYEGLRNDDEPARVKLWTVPGADHLESLAVMPEAYVNCTLAWFEQWM